MKFGWSHMLYRPHFPEFRKVFEGLQARRTAIVSCLSVQYFTGALKVLLKYKNMMETKTYNNKWQCNVEGSVNAFVLTYS